MSRQIVNIFSNSEEHSKIRKEYGYVWIKEFLESDNKFLIPDFQRNFVWKEKNIISLLETIRDNKPIPMLFLWNFKTDDVEHTSLYKLNKMINLPAEQFTGELIQMENNTRYIVVDGQQRLSSLLIAYNLNKQGKNCYISKNDDIGYQFYFSKEKKSDDDIYFCDIFKTDNPKYEDIKKIFENSYIPAWIASNNRDFFDICTIFNTINSTGKKITTADLLFSSISKLRNQNIDNISEAKEKIKHFLQTFKKLSNEYGAGFVSNMVFLLANINPKISLGQINNDTNLKKVRKAILDNELSQNIESYISNIDKNLQKLISSFSTAFMLFYIVKYITNVDDEKILILFLLLDIGTAGTQNTIERFYEYILNLKNKEVITYEFLFNYFNKWKKMIYNNFDDFISKISDTKDKAKQKIIIYTLMKNDNIYIDSLRIEDIDHLMPFHWFQKWTNPNNDEKLNDYVKQQKYNGLPNKQILYSKYNKMKGKMSLDEWINKNRENDFYLDPWKMNRGNALKNGLYKNENFVQFYDERRELIIERMKKYFK